MEATNLAGRYELPLRDWSAIKRRLDRGLTSAPETDAPGGTTQWRF